MEKKVNKPRVADLDKKQKKVIKDPLAGVYVTGKFYCLFCSSRYGEYVAQSSFRRLPRSVIFRGKSYKTRQPNGVILKPCQECTKKLKEDLEIIKDKRSQR